MQDYPVAIIGSGPVGMAAAAHLTEREIPFLVFEAGNSIGANLLDWGHVQVFTPWKYNVDKAAERLLSDINWQKPVEDGLPTGKEIVDQYLLPLSFHPKIEPNIHLSSKVISITKKGLDKMKTQNREQVSFIVTVEKNRALKTFEASGVIDSSGTWNNPNPIGAGGIFAEGEKENAGKIAYRIPDILGKDKKRYADKNVVVIGGGHSAINSLLDLATLKGGYPATKMHWVLRANSLSAIYGGKEDDSLEARGALGIRIEELVNSGQLQVHTPYFIHEFARANSKLNIKGYIRGDYYEIEEVDEVIANTGARPDLSILREVRVDIDPALESVPDLAELIDPNIHSCGTVRPHGELELRQPEKNFYIAGAKSYGRAPTFLMATGYEQVRSIAAWLDGDIESARRVELDLPETGVCSTDNTGGAACCGTGKPEKNIEVSEETCCSSSNNNQTNTNNMVNITREPEEPAATGCCGGAPANDTDACCQLDEQKKAQGEAGCGCSSEPDNQVQETTSSCC